MKLSEAIMMNGMYKPQGFGMGSLYSIDAPCAMGGALQSINKSQDWREFDKAWPWTSEVSYCPGCDEKMPISAIIWHLNDQHRWSRTAIAEWVASIEPSESQEPVSAPDYQECNEAIVNVS